jgi:hypothetical protein
LSIRNHTIATKPAKGKATGSSGYDRRPHGYVNQDGASDGRSGGQLRQSSRSNSIGGRASIDRSRLEAAAEDMNWQRGAFRLWVVGSLIWMVAAIWLRHSRDSALPAPPLGSRTDVSFHDWVLWLQTVIAPPRLVGVIGLLAGWVIGGFRKPT